MNIHRDKLQHAIGGALVALGTLLVLLVAVHAGIALALVAAGAGVGFGYEAVQKIRGEGQPELQDAVATMAGSIVVAVAWHFLWPLFKGV